MNDFGMIYKVNKKIFETQSLFVNLYGCVEDIVNNPTSENVQDLTTLINSIDTSIDVLKGSLKMLLENVANIETDEIEGEETENGIKV